MVPCRFGHFPLPASDGHPIATALTAVSWQEGDPLRNAAARLRAAVILGTAVATLFTLTPAASAAPAELPATPAGLISAPLSAPVDSSLETSLGTSLDALIGSLDAPVDLLPGAGGSLLNVFTPPTLLINGAEELAPVADAVSTTTAAARVISEAREHLGARYV